MHIYFFSCGLLLNITVEYWQREGELQKRREKKDCEGILYTQVPTSMRVAHSSHKLPALRLPLPTVRTHTDFFSSF